MAAIPAHHHRSAPPSLSTARKKAASRSGDLDAAR
jgi:hypothetical protein